MTLARFTSRFLVTVALLSRPLWAQGPASPDSTGSFDAASDPEALIRAGLEARKSGDDQKALELFRQALAIKASPRALAQVGMAEQALGRWADAETHLKEALGAKDDAWIVSHRETLEGAVTEVGRRLGSLEITCNVPDADVVIDGDVRGKTPLSKPLRLVSGTYAVELRHTGYYALARRIQVDAGRVEHATLELKPAPQESGAPAPAAGGGTPPVLAKGAEPPAAERPAPEAESTRFGTVKWIAMGGTGVLLATSVATLVMREGQVSAYNDDASCPGTDSGNQPGNCDSRLSSGKTLGTVSIVAGVAAAALGITTGVLFALDEPERTVACAPGNQPLSVTCFARF